MSRLGTGFKLAGGDPGKLTKRVDESQMNDVMVTGRTPVHWDSDVPGGAGGPHETSNSVYYGRGGEHDTSSGLDKAIRALRAIPPGGVVGEHSGVNLDRMLGGGADHDGDDTASSDSAPARVGAEDDVQGR
jgi:hypothetical protein